MIGSQRTLNMQVWEATSGKQAEYGGVSAGLGMVGSVGSWSRGTGRGDSVRVQGRGTGLAMSVQCWVGL